MSMRTYYATGGERGGPLFIVHGTPTPQVATLEQRRAAKAARKAQRAARRASRRGRS